MNPVYRPAVRRSTCSTDRHFQHLRLDLARGSLPQVTNVKVGACSRRSAPTARRCVRRYTTNGYDLFDAHRQHALTRDRRTTGPIRFEPTLLPSRRSAITAVDVVSRRYLGSVQPGNRRLPVTVTANGQCRGHPPHRRVVTLTRMRPRRRSRLPTRNGSRSILCARLFRSVTPRAAIGSTARTSLTTRSRPGSRPPSPTRSTRTSAPTTSGSPSASPTSTARFPSAHMSTPTRWPARIPRAGTSTSPTSATTTPASRAARRPRGRSEASRSRSASTTATPRPAAATRCTRSTAPSPRTYRCRGQGTRRWRCAPAAPSRPATLPAGGAYPWGGYDLRMAPLDGRPGLNGPFRPPRLPAEGILAQRLPPERRVPDPAAQA
jgi:hypothetical protein